MPELDERQQRAVDAGPTDLFIAAGAGSGKTRVLTARFVAAILGEPPYEPTDPEALLTVTYTEKAAGELKERTRRALIESGRPDAARRVPEAWISTIHGMCSRILRRHALDIGIDPRFTMLDEVESAIVETEALDQALGQLMEEDHDVAELVGALSFSVVATAVRTARADLLAAGLGVDQLHTLDSAQIARRCTGLAREARDLSREFSALGAGKTTAANAQAAGELAATLEQLSDPDAHPEGVLATLGGVSFRHQRSVEGHECLVDAAKELHEDARMCVAQYGVRRYEDAFARLVGRFDAIYTEAKRARGTLDFEDLQMLTADLLRGRPDIAGRYRRHFMMVMVDEFQDTNALQLEIIGHLADGDLCTVGDENQSIYSFRHADVEVFRAHGRSVGERVELDINYRIAEPLLDAINGLFSHRLLLGDAYMTLRSPAVSPPRDEWPSALARFAVQFVDTVGSDTDPQTAEASAIANRVVEYVRSGIAPGDIAVLLGALSRGQGAAVERELAAHGIPASLSAGGAFFDCQEIAEVRSLLRVIDNVHDDHAMLTLLAGRLAGLGPDALWRIRSVIDEARTDDGTGHAPNRRVSLWDASRRAAGSLPVGESHAVGRVIAAVEEARALHGVRPLGDTIIQTLLTLDYDLTLFGAGHRGLRAWANVLKLARMADEFEAAGPGGLGGFIRHLELRETHATGEQEAVLDVASDAVRIMSIHAAKGLEFPVVVVGSLTSDSGAPPIGLTRIDGKMLLGMMLPGAEANEKTLAWRTVADAKAAVRDAERRRLFYVACTRAREGLAVVCRTRSDRAAGTSVSGLLRTVFGMGEPGALRDCDHASGTGTINISVIEGAPASAGEADTALTLADATQPKRCEATVGTEAAAPATAPSVPVVAPVQPVSYTALATYERCPYHYHLVRVARLPQPRRAGTTDALEFGSALHLVLQHADAPEDIGPLLDAALGATGLDPARRTDLDAAATAYLRSPLAQRVRAAERVDHEAPFLVPVAGTVLSGAIDVIAWSGSRALIVDYKTGSGQLDPETARERYRLQAECYGLAALHAGAQSVEIVFTELERGREVAFLFDASDEPALADRIATPVHAIARAEFAPLEAYVRGLCDVCPGFGGLCPVTRPSAGAAG